MKVKFIGSADMNSKGINFVPGFEYEVSSEVANYLEKTFSNVFEVTKAEVKVQEVVKDKPKVDTKVTPKD